MEKIDRCSGGEKSVESCHVSFSGPELNSSQGAVLRMIYCHGVVAPEPEKSTGLDCTGPRARPRKKLPLKVSLVAGQISLALHLYLQL